MTGACRLYKRCLVEVCFEEGDSGDEPLKEDGSGEFRTAIDEMNLRRIRDYQIGDRSTCDAMIWFGH